MRQNVLLLCRYQSVYGGNFIPSLMALEDSLREKGIGCVYCFPTESEERYWFKKLRDMGRQLVTIPYPIAFIEFNRKIKEICVQFNISIVYAHFMRDSEIELLSLLNRNLHVYIHMHSDFSAGEKISKKVQIKKKLVYKYLSKRVEFISVSNDLVSLNPSKITWIPNALAVDRIPCQQMSRDDVRKALGIKDDEVLIELFGWSPYVKGVDIAVNAVKKMIEETGANVKLAIICGREMVPEKMKAWVCDHTLCSGNEHYLIYLQPREDVFAFHNGADVLISASRSEGFSYAILEMLSLGKRCVVSDIPGTRWAGEFHTTYLFETQNAEDCALKLGIAIKQGNNTDDSTAQEVLNRFSINRWTSEVMKILLGQK